MSRLHYLVRKDITLYNVGQNNARIGLKFDDSHGLNDQPTSGYTPLANIVAVYAEEDQGSWFVVPIPGPDDPNNSDPYFTIQDSQTFGFAFVSPYPHSFPPPYSPPIVVGPYSATSFRIRFISQSETRQGVSGHIIYLAERPDLCWALTSTKSGTAVTLKKNPVDIPNPPQARSTFQKHDSRGDIPPTPFDLTTLWVFERD